MIREAYGRDATSKSQVFEWHKKFKEGREDRSHTNKSDEPCSGRPKTNTTPEIAGKIHDRVLDDHRIKVCEIEHTTGICYKGVVYILHNELGL
ncbi:unnamed protein product, partial [Ixodes hexagonus]